MPGAARDKTNRRGVICSGNTVYDTLVKPVEELHWGGTTFVDSIECHIGGNGANTARALGRLGVPVRLLGAVGDDEQGCMILREFEKDYVETARMERLPGQTAASVGVISPTGDRKFFHTLGVGRQAFSKLISFDEKLCDGMAHYHMASLFVLPQLCPHGPEVLLRARQAGLSTSFDTNWDPQNRWMQTLAPCLPCLDFLFTNEEEAPMISGTKDTATTARLMLQKGLRTAVMKLGCRGCAIFTDSEEVICPAYDVKAIDTTGAGDTFVAGFLTAWLDGASLRESGQFANAVGALCVQKIGATTGILSRPATEEWMRTARPRSILSD